MLNIEELKIIKRILEKEFDWALSLNQIINFNIAMDRYLSKYNNYDEFKLVLFGSKIRNEIKSFYDKDRKSFINKKYPYQSTVDYSVKRTLSNVFDGFDVKPVSDYNTEENVQSIEAEMRLYKKDNHNLSLKRK